MGYYTSYRTQKFYIRRDEMTKIDKLSKPEKVPLDNGCFGQLEICEGKNDMWEDFV